jgi:ribonuclease E
MAGLVVIDFIDMEYSSNIRKVEKCMKDALRHDRARIQVGRISGFGLMEMSRQRLRTGVLEATTRECPHCDGTGLVRTASSAGLSALRLIEDEAAKGKGTVITLFASTEAAVYLLNAKRADLAEIEHRYGVTVEVLPEGEEEGAKMRVASSGPRPTSAPKFEPIVDDDADDEPVEDDEDEDIENEEAGTDSRRDEDGEDRHGKRRRRRGGRGRKRREDDERDESREIDDATGDELGEEESERAEVHGDEDSRRGEDEEGKPKKRRRRGGRRRRGRGREDGGETGGDEAGEQAEQVSDQLDDDIAVVAGPDETPGAAEPAADDEDKPKKRARRKKAAVEEPAEEDTAAKVEAETEVPTPQPKRKSRSPRKAAAEQIPATEQAPVVEEAPDAEGAVQHRKRAPRRKKADEGQPEGATIDPVTAPAEEPAGTAAPANDTDEGKSARRGGWWQRTFGE